MPFVSAILGGISRSLLQWSRSIFHFNRFGSMECPLYLRFWEAFRRHFSSSLGQSLLWIVLAQWNDLCIWILGGISRSLLQRCGWISHLNRFGSMECPLYLRYWEEFRGLFSNDPDRSSILIVLVQWNALCICDFGRNFEVSSPMIQIDLPF